MIQQWLVRIFLSPFSLLYGGIISLRNTLYETGIVKSTSFNLPIIGVGNLSIGGAGKTPHVEYLISFLRQYINVAVISRGYKRKSKGFRLVNIYDTVFQSGDEPIQYKRKFRDVVIAVAESRATAIPEVIKHYPSTQVILLDDAFQHRSVKPGLNILLTEFSNPYTRDYILPAGRLREWRKDALRADVIIVTKCPSDLTVEERTNIRAEIDPKDHQKLLFSHYQYLNPYNLFNGNERIIIKDQAIILLAAIASSEYLEEYLNSVSDQVVSYKFEDHHYFTERDLTTLQKANENLVAEHKIILTTEKDAVRLYEHKSFFEANNLQVYVLPIFVEFLDDDGHQFNKLVKDYLLNVKV